MAEWGQRVQQSAQRGDDKQLETLLSLRDAHAAQLFGNGGDEAVISRASDVVRGNDVLKGVIVSHARAAFAWYQSDDAVTASKNQYDVVHTLRSESAFSWAHKTLITAAVEWGRLMKAAKRQLLREGRSEEVESEFSRYFNELRQSFQLLLRHQKQENYESQSYLLPIVNLFLKAAYEESNITTLKSVFSILDTVASVGNKGDAVVFYYYQGLYLMDSKQQAKAATVFLKAFRLCPASSVNNRRLILEYLIPLMMFHGYMPTAKLLEQYNLSAMFGSIATALRRGDLALFDRAFAENEAHFFRRGTSFLFAEDIQYVLHENLLRKIVRLRSNGGLQLDEVCRAVQLGRPHVPYEEVECIVANMLKRKYINGYINAEERCVVGQMTRAKKPALFSRRRARVIIL